jgi:hypothetical protein
MFTLRRGVPKPEITAEEVVLTLLLAGKHKPVKGKLMLMKLAFLASKEVLTNRAQRFRFRPYSYGPYSDEVASGINELIEQGLVLSSVKQVNIDSYRYDYWLSEMGEKRAMEEWRKLESSETIGLDRLRAIEERFGYWGIVRHVYNKYPEFAVASRIRN